MRSLYVLALPALLVAILFSGRPSHAGELSKGQLLYDAWEEYSFQNWDMSHDKFVKVLEGKPTSKQKLQARIGIIFIQQYRAPGYDHEGAIESYKALLADLENDKDGMGADPSIYPFINFNMGYAYAAKQTPDMDEARKLFLGVINQSFEKYHKDLEAFRKEQAALPAAERKPEPPIPFLAQQAVLRYLETYMLVADEETVKEGLAEAKRLVPMVKGGMYASLVHSQAASLAFVLGENQYGIEQLIKQYECGITNRSIKERVLFKIARTYEMVFKDYDNAAKYYGIFAKELPTSTRYYFCKIRSEELQKGIVDSEIFKGSLVRKALEKAEKEDDSESAKETEDSSKESEPSEPAKAQDDQAK